MAMPTRQKTILQIVEYYDKNTLHEKDAIAGLVAKAYEKSVREITSKDVLMYHKQLLKEFLDIHCESEIEDGFVFSGNNHHYRTNRDDQINFIGQYLALKDNEEITQLFWKTEDEGQQPITREEFFLVYQEALIHKNNVILKFWNKKAIIDSCQSHAEVRAVSWDKPDEEIQKEIALIREAEQPKSETEPNVEEAQTESDLIE